MVVLAVCGAVLGWWSLTACGAEDGGSAAGTTEPPSSTTTVWTDATTSIPATSTTSMPELRCGPLTAGDVAGALGVDSTEVLVGHRPTGEPDCSFQVGQWEVSSSVDDVLSDVPTTAPAPASTVPGLRSRSLLDVQIQRGGRYAGRADLLHDGAMYTVVVTNLNEGSDTYPPVADSPPQARATWEVTVALARAVDGSL